MLSSLLVIIFFRNNAFSAHPIGIGRLTGRNLRVNVNFAERAHNHNWKLDPIVRSLLDTDFYKLLMLQFIWKNFPAIHVTSEVTNRTVSVRLAEQIPMAMLVDQMGDGGGLRVRGGGDFWGGGEYVLWDAEHL